MSNDDIGKIDKATRDDFGELPRAEFLEAAHLCHCPKIIQDRYAAMMELFKEMTLSRRRVEFELGMRGAPVFDKGCEEAVSHLKANGVAFRPLVAIDKEYLDRALEASSQAMNEALNAVRLAHDCAGRQRAADKGASDSEP